GSAPHPPTSPPISEQDPQAWWDALVEAFSQLGKLRNSVVAISVAAQQHGLVLADANGHPLRKAKLWNDLSSADQAERLVSEIGMKAWVEAVGSVPVAAFTITKLAWIAQHEPHLLDETEYVLLPHDWLNFRLTGRACTDRGDASGTGWYSSTKDQVRLDLLEAATGSRGKWLARLPSVLGPMSPAGTLTSEAATMLGLANSVLVGPGTGDNMAAALGLGLSIGDIALSLGTSGTVYSVSAQSTADRFGLVAGFADATGNYLPLACTLNATRVTDTVAEWLNTDPSGLSEMALNADLGSPGPTLLPYFDGERTPNLPEAAGILSGLTTETSREQIALAAHDGVLCGLLSGLDALLQAGVRANGRLHLIGGGSRSMTYRQRCADLHGRPILVPDTQEVVAAGAAVQAAMVQNNRSPTELADAWNLGSGTLIEPHNDTSEVRDSYRAAAEHTAEDWPSTRGCT
ncbi:MAG: xylulokinase, partial [Acidimicrobiales bacterium]